METINIGAQHKILACWIIYQQIWGQIKRDYPIWVAEWGGGKRKKRKKETETLRSVGHHQVQQHRHSIGSRKRREEAENIL